MLFSVGYQLRPDNDFIDCIVENKKNISEVYFSFSGIPNGRNTNYISDEFSPFMAEEKRKSDLDRLSKEGIRLNLLLNGNCYGKYALARSFYTKIGDTIDHLQGKFDLTNVTTTSPLIAKFIKQNFSDIKVRASVNIGVEAPDGMDYIKDLFDEFYLKREYNRNSEKLKIAKEWCDQNGKKLFGLANSGCLNFCSAHTFHDNLVAHESEVSEMDNCYQFQGQCYEYLKDAKAKDWWLQKTNFIRPEDVSLYEEYFEGLKLATRVNFNPRKIVEAYCKGSYKGNLPEILEPNHSGLFLPNVIENGNIPQSFAKTVMTCNKNCKSCGFCKTAQSQATITLE